MSQSLTTMYPALSSDAIPDLHYPYLYHLSTYEWPATYPFKSIASHLPNFTLPYYIVPHTIYYSLPLHTYLLLHHHSYLSMQYHRSKYRRAISTRKSRTPTAEEDDIANMMHTPEYRKCDVMTHPPQI